jgi:excisionase family DNA binding protein
MQTESKTSTLTIDEAVRESGVSRTQIYMALGAGKLEARKFGRRTILIREEWEAFLRNLPVAKINVRPAQPKAA